MANRAQRRAAQRGTSGAVDLAQLKPKGLGKVVVAYPHPSEISAHFHEALFNLIVHDAYTVQRIIGRISTTSGANIVQTRNNITQEFLEHPSGAEWLWMLDDDMTFEIDTLERLMDSANRNDRPVMGGLCFAYRPERQHPIVPTIYMPGQGNTFANSTGYPQNQIVQVMGTGAACLLVHRKVFEGIRDLEDADGNLVNPKPHPWFANLITGNNYGDIISEDLTFCLRAAQAGFPIHIDTSIKIGHVKPVVIDEAMYLRFAPQPEAPAPTYVVIPVRGKHEFTNALLAQLDEQGGYEKVFVFDNSVEGDEYQRHADDGFHRNMAVLPASGKSIHAMWNEGVKLALAENPRCNIAILNNDLELGPNFLQEMAKGLRLDPSFGAVSANYDNRNCPEFVQGVRGIAAGREDGSGGLAGFAFMVKGEIFAAMIASGMDPFDEQFELWYGDNDFTLRLDEAQVPYGIVRDAHVVHIGGGSNTSGDGVHRLANQELRDMAERDRVRFEKKWANR